MTARRSAGLKRPSVRASSIIASSRLVSVSGSVTAQKVAPGWLVWSASGACTNSPEADKLRSMPSAQHQPPGRVAVRAAERSSGRAGPLARMQAVLVLIIAAAPLTASGHYFANRVTGHGGSAGVASLLWLPVFTAIGLGLVAAGLAALAPGWHRSGTRTTVAMLAVGLIAATTDWMRLVGSRTGMALNAAGAGVAMACLLGAVARRRAETTRIAPRNSELVLEWFGSLLVFGAALALVLPHTVSIHGVQNDCSPMWAILETRCWNPDTPWWPLPVAAAVMGLTTLAIVRSAPVTR